MVQKKKNDRFFYDGPIIARTPRRSFCEHLEYSLVKSRLTVKERDSYQAMALAIRDRLIRRWLRTQHEYDQQDVKKVYYLSMDT
jgi:starch phosphorylase